MTLRSVKRTHGAIVAIGLAAFMFACGGGGVSDPTSGGGSPQSGGASGQAGMPGSGGAAQGGVAGTASGGTGGVTCGRGCITLCQGGICDCHCEASCENYSAPPYEKSCARDEDCFAGIHTTDCCGSKRVLGYNVAEQDRFASYEAACTAQAVCRCAPAEPTIESGQITADLELRTAVCNAGQCVGSGPVNTGAP